MNIDTDRYNIAVVTNDIFTKEDGEFLVRNEALAPERIVPIETGNLPHPTHPLYPFLLTFFLYFSFSLFI